MFDFKKYLSRVEDEHLSGLFSRYKGHRDVLMLRLLRKYGMRASELLGLKVSDLDFDGLGFTVSGLKGSHPRFFPVPPDLFDELRKIAKECSGVDDRLFPIGYSRLGQIWRMYRPSKKPLHSLRHTFAVEMYEKTRDPLYLQESLGHKSMASTLVYARVINKEQKDRRYFCGK